MDVTETSVYHLTLRYALNGAPDQTEVYGKMKNAVALLKEHGFISIQVTAAGTESSLGENVTIFKDPLIM